MRITSMILMLLLAGVAQAGELEQAYEKEYAYLVAEKTALEQRLASVKRSQQLQLKTAVAEIDALEKSLLSKQNITDRLNRDVAETTRNTDFAEDDRQLLDTTLIQAKESLSKSNMQLDESKAEDQRLDDAFTLANKILVSDGKVSSEKGSYFLLGGETVEGTLINIGRIAKYGVSAKGSGTLAPAGDGKFKLWSSSQLSTANQLADNLRPNTLDIFLYDNTEKAIDKRDETTFDDEVKAGGVVGNVIIGLGIVGFLLMLLRIVFLLRAGFDTRKIASEVNSKVQNGDISNGLEVCKKRISSASNVIASTLRNLDRSRDHIEDIISEAILHESSRIDRFGSAILVIAAVSPLLGLLGTVTGMIGTFDIITEFGTGDPKLLSSGISEALVTTKFGLIVAIPLLLAGNVLSSWGQRIKNDLEQAALHMINTHKK